MERLTILNDLLKKYQHKAMPENKSKPALVTRPKSNKVKPTQVTPEIVMQSQQQESHETIKSVELAGPVKATEPVKSVELAEPVSNRTC